MIRTLFLLLAWFVAVPSFSQGKPTSPSTQEQLLELRLEQQHLKEKLDDQKASLEEKFEVKKENLEYQREETNGWITLFGLVVTVIGIGLPVIGFFIGKRIVMDIERQKVGMVLEQEELKSQITKKQEEVDKKHQEQLVWMETLRLDAEKTFNSSKAELQKMAIEIEELVKEAKKDGQEIKIIKGDAVKKNKDINTITESSQSREAIKPAVDDRLQSKVILGGDNDTPFQKEIDKALELYFAGKHKESIKQHLSILDEYKSELTLEQLPDFYFRLAYSYGELGDKDSEIKYYEKGLEERKGNDAVWHNLGVVYEENENYEKAIECYSEALRLFPHTISTWINLGVTYDKHADFDKAIECYKKVVIMEPDNSLGWNNMGIAYYHKEEYNKAIEMYSKAVKIKPDYFDAWNNMGIAYASKDEYVVAIEKYCEAIKLKSDNAEVWNNIGNSYRGKCDYDKAIESFGKALDINSDFLEAWNNLGFTYYCQGNYDKARECYEEAINRKPDYTIAIINLIELFIVQNIVVEEILSKLKVFIQTEYDRFNYLLLETIHQAKSKTYSETIDNTLILLKQTVNDDANKVAWDFKILKDWLAREEASPIALDKEAREFITDLIQRIEEWRGSQPKAE